VLPITLDPTAISVGLAGAGDGRTRREAFLRGAGIAARSVAPDAGERGLRGLSVLFAAGLDREASASLAARARAAGILVNVEDVPELCDFHVPAIVRRGDLLISISTSGRAPGLARLIREWLERKLGPEWSGHLDAVGRARAVWRAQGLPSAEVARRTRTLAAEKELFE
jgi:precorrin-2 dehydrogenase / sirohydrochlorin ferrochelatase